MGTSRVPLAALAIVAVSQLTGCDTSDPMRGHARLNKPFTVAVGDHVVLDDVMLMVTFDEVVSDSRCPVEIQCQVSGFAAIKTSVSSSGHAPETLSLTTENLPASRAGYNEFLITLERVDPPAHVNVALRPGDYRATLRVTKKP